MLYLYSKAEPKQIENYNYVKSTLNLTRMRIVPKGKILEVYYCKIPMPENQPLLF